MVVCLLNWYIMCTFPLPASTHGCNWISRSANTRAYPDILYRAGSCVKCATLDSLCGKTRRKAMLSLSDTCRKKNGHFLLLLKSFSVNAGGAPNGTVIKNILHVCVGHNLQ